MKKLIYPIVLMIIVSLGNYSLNAQNQVTIAKNDTLIIELDGRANGNILWQKSTDNVNWNNLYTNSSSVLDYIITEPGYFRSEVTNSTLTPYYSDILSVNMVEKFVVKAGHGFVEPYVPSNPGLSMQERGVLSGWTNTNRKATWYLYQKAGTYDMSLYLSSSVQGNYSFKLATTQCYDGLGYQPTTETFSYTSSGNNMKEEIPATTITIPTTGYYRYELEAKSDMTGITIDELWFTSVIEPGQTGTFETHATDYLSSPSVHLSFSTTDVTSREYDWLYEEILVPEGEDPLSTYWMSIGFFRGYMGIQTNSDTERRVLFSAWDAVDVDRYPNAPKELLVSLVDKAEYTKANSFGNEGTGGQSYVGVGNPNTWKTGVPVKFLMNSRRDGSLIYNGDVIKHTVVSAWYDAGEGWCYIASWRIPVMPGGRDMFDGFYSFLENYGWRNGHLSRKGYYYNAFGREIDSNRWVHFNKVGFSNTDGSEGQRIDFEQGVSVENPQYFYMRTGGFDQMKKTANEMALQTNYPTMDLAPFTARVNEALEAERRMNNMVVRDKTGWEVVDYSSEETSGEGGGNGLAANVIDGNTSSYWHSKWTGGGSSYPHYMVIDMKKKEAVDAFKFTLSGGTNRYMKNIKIEKSDDAQNWTQLMHLDAPNESTYLLWLTGQDSFRYFKLTIYNGQTDEVHTRINEIDVLTVPAGIDKSTWSLIDFSSEASTGESNGNGFAALVIDGDDNTYWHSQWQYGGSAYPHYLSIDMSKEETVNGFEFMVSGGTNRHMKNIKIEKSNDGQNWEEILHQDAPDTDRYRLDLPEPNTFRFFKLTVYSGYNDEGGENVHTRINEITVY